MRRIYWITNASKIILFPMPQAWYAARGDICPFFFCSTSCWSMLWLKNMSHFGIISTFWMCFSARLQLSVSACGDTTPYQLKLRLETSTLVCMKLSFKQGLSLISSREVWKQSLAQSLLSDCPSCHGIGCHE